VAAFRHIVLFQVHPGVTDPQVDEAVDALRSLGSLPGIERWRVERSLDDRKGVVIVEDATFVDRAAFEAFRSSDEHRAVGEWMAAISDWLIGDFADGT